MNLTDSIFGSRRPEENSLDLNNFPDDYSRDGKQVLEDSSSGWRKKKSGKEGKEECEKVYECRFCSLKFCKSQALGGHMNRHRQERETETLNHARQLVFRNDPSIVVPQPPLHHLGCCQQPGGSYNNVGRGGDPTMSLRFPAYLSHSSSSSHASRHHHPVSHHYRVGHALHSHSSYVGSTSTNGGESGYTCVGAPVGHGFGGDDGSLQHSHGYPASVINRFQDGF